MTRTKQWLSVLGLVLVAALAVVAFQAAVAAQPAHEPAALAEPSRMFIAPTTTSVSQGDVFTVGVMVENAQDMISYEFRMIWDSSVLTFTDVADAGFLLGTAQSSPPEITAGAVRFGAFVPPPYDGADGDGMLAVVTLEALRSGVSALHLTHAEWYDADSPNEPHTPARDGGMVYVDMSFVHLPLVLRAFGP